MAATTGPIAAATAIVAGSAILIHDMPPLSQARTVVGGAIAAAGLALLEHALPGVAIALAWTVLVVVLFVRVNPATPAPIESLNTWINGK